MYRYTKQGQNQSLLGFQDLGYIRGSHPIDSHTIDTISTAAVPLTADHDSPMSHPATAAR